MKELRLRKSKWCEYIANTWWILTTDQVWVPHVWIAISDHVCHIFMSMILIKLYSCWINFIELNENGGKTLASICHKGKFCVLFLYCPQLYFSLHFFSKLIPGTTCALGAQGFLLWYSTCSTQHPPFPLPSALTSSLFHMIMLLSSSSTLKTQNPAVRWSDKLTLAALYLHLGYQAISDSS